MYVVYIRLPHSCLKKRFTASGFTLVELVTVLLLVAILSVIAITRLPSGSINLQPQAEQLSSDIRYTQSLAMHRGQRHRIYLFTNRYWLADGSGTRVAHPVTGMSDAFLDNGISLTAIPYPFIEFDGDGAPYDNVGTALTADVVLTLSIGTNSLDVRISPETGRTIIQ